MLKSSPFRWRMLVVSLLVIIVSSFGFYAQNDDIQKPSNFPRRAITWIVPYGPGGGSDSFARQLSKQAEKMLGVPVRIVNKPGGGGLAALPSVMAAPADGYTLYGAGPYINIGELLGNIQFSHNDLEIVAQGQRVVTMFFVRVNDSRFESWEDVVELAKRNPGKLTIATAGLGGIEEIVTAVVEKQANIDFTIIPFDNPGERYSNFIGGETDLLYEQPGDVKGLLDAGEIKPVIVLRDTEERLGGFEDVPTSMEFGVEVSIARWRGIAVRKGVPEERLEYLEKVFHQAWLSQEYQEFQERKYLHYIYGWKNHEEMEQYMENEYELFKQKLKELGYELAIAEDEN